MLSALSKLRVRLAEWWAVEDPDERIEGSGEVYLDPAYNPGYTAERNLQRLAAADEESEDDQS